MVFDGSNYKVMAFLDTSNMNAEYSPFKYLEEKDKLLDYLMVRKDNLNNMHHYTQRKEKTNNWFRKEWVGPQVVDININDSSWEEIEYNGEVFLFNREYEYKTNKRNNKRRCDYYVEVKDRIYDDLDYQWKEDSKGIKTTSTEENSFKFVITYRPLEKRAYIEVKYIKCENRHRNIVTMTEIEVINPTNEAIKAAIRQWKKELKESIL